MSGPRAPFDLMLVVDPRAPGVLDALARFSSMASGERIAVQLRAKDASDVALIAMAREVAAVQPAMSRLIVNGRAGLARAIAADGVHLPEDGGTVGAARSAAPGAMVGVSVHDEAGVRRRSAEGADYVLLGPLGAVPGKPALDEAAFRAAATAAAVPVIALGGIGAESDADRALALGASAIAVQRALVAPGAAAWLARWLARR